MTARLLVARIQAIIEDLYRIEAPARAEDFCIDAAQLEQLLGEPVPPSMREALLIHHDGEETSLALYLDADTFRRAAALLDHGQVDAASVDALCVVVEGVSHFVYFTFCGAAQDRPVSQIELELQAEVDKFILLRLLSPIPGLLERLFRHYRLAAHLDLEQQRRYHVASGRAHRYARWLERKLAVGEAHQALADARVLYRKPLEYKLDHIGRAA
ncbi:MAG: hypothetical protein IT384_21360 [Deltaproteobacteria bacterium]|nr:hypothetical protein [Deltaproteobacteria bacterium]